MELLYLFLLGSFFFLLFDWRNWPFFDGRVLFDDLDDWGKINLRWGRSSWMFLWLLVDEIVIKAVVESFFFDYGGVGLLFFYFFSTYLSIYSYFLLVTVAVTFFPRYLSSPGLYSMYCFCFTDEIVGEIFSIDCSLCVVFASAFVGRVVADEFDC